MEEELTPSNLAQEVSNETLCGNCKIHKFEEGYAINLCSECRQALIKYPIPKGIKIFGLVLLAIIIISLVRTRLYISVAYHLSKAENSIADKHYATAQKELSKVLEKFPNHVDANANMIIAASYNLDPLAAVNAYKKVEGKKIEDEELFSRVNTAMSYLDQNFPQDTVMPKRVYEVRNSKEQLMGLYEKLQRTDLTVDGMVMEVHVANYLYDQKDYETAEQILNEVLNKQPDLYRALSLMSAIQRNIGEYDQALALCDRMLQINKEDVYAIAQKAKVELKRKHDKQADRYAAEAMKINSNNDAALEARAMVDYFAGKHAESTAGLAKIKKHEIQSEDHTISNRLGSIINGSEAYR